ncbi:uncharacterized protein [Centruroides vittatus]|uniref:uncharacterized protein n=1 Tax=Centruroides vittatus TaxID=120091 RepID=UPI00350FE223
MNISNKIKKYITKKKEGNQVKKFLLDNNLDILKADKSKQLIIVYSDWIKKKKYDLVESEKFRLLPIDPKEVIQKELKNRITKLQKLNKLTKQEKEFILNDNNDRTPKINIHLKTHKPGDKVRPIIDFKNSPLYNLEKFLKQQLKQFQNSTFTIMNTDELLHDIKKLKIERNMKIASLDITDMYPSMTWDIIEPKLMKLNVEPEIINLIEFAYKSNYFEYEGNYYTQEEGISMGSVIGPKLAELNSVIFLRGCCGISLNLYGDIAEFDETVMEAFQDLLRTVTEALRIR